MYESHFLLSQRPFAPSPNAEVYVPVGSVEQARQTLTRCIDRSEGPGLAIGPAGTGKTLLCNLLGSQFRGRFQVAHLGGARLSTRRALLQNILFELKLPYREMDEGELRLSLVDHLEPRASGPEGLLLLVDEAHTLPLRLLEEVRLLTNVVRDGQSRLRLVLAGGMALEERLSSPRLESFHQRIAARCYLQPLRRDETIFYVQEQIRRCGGSADNLFTSAAQSAIQTATDGIPRLINQVCDHALMLAALGGTRQLEATGIEEAWADLQQLPLPLTDERSSVGSGSGRAGMVEFGQLGAEPAIVAGTIGPGDPEKALADATVSKLESISRTLDALGQEQTLEPSRVVVRDDFSPAVSSGTEVELFFHSAHDPFGGNWDDEEVVIDRYASLEDAALRAERVRSETGRALGAAVSAAAKASEQCDAAAPKVELKVQPAITAEFDPAEDPLLPEETPIESRPSKAAISLRSVTQDDRDMIFVEDEPAPANSAVVQRPRRAEYRQLFSRLRGK